MREIYFGPLKNPANHGIWLPVCHQRFHNSGIALRKAAAYTKKKRSKETEVISKTPAIKLSTITQTKIEKRPNYMTVLHFETWFWWIVYILYGYCVLLYIAFAILALFRFHHFHVFIFHTVFLYFVDP